MPSAIWRPWESNTKKGELKAENQRKAAQKLANQSCAYQYGAITEATPPRWNSPYCGEGAFFILFILYC